MRTFLGLSWNSEPTGAAGAPRADTGALLAALLATLACLTTPCAPVRTDIDSCWRAVLSVAHEQGLQFGTDIVFTYGPLGFLTLPCFTGGALAARTLVDVSLCFLVATGCCLLAWRLSVARRSLLLGIFILLSANINSGVDLLLEFGLLCWGLLCLLEAGRRLGFCLLSFLTLAVFATLAKVSYFITAGLSIGAISSDLLLRGQRRLALGLFCAYGAGLVAVWMLSGQDLWHLRAFVQNGFLLSQQFDQVMGMGVQCSRKVKTGGLITLFLAVGTVLVRSLTAYRVVDRNRVFCRRALLLAWLSSLLFVNWKHGFVRPDWNHLEYFLAFVPMLGLGLEALPCEREAAKAWARGFGIAACVFALVTSEWRFFPGYLKFCAERTFRVVPRNVRNLARPRQYQQEMAEALESERRAAQLPTLRRVIDRASVDVFGNSQAFAVFNDLNYRPRPAFQSEMAVCSPVMKLNEEFYLSGRAPDYVLFRLDPIDHRFPALEDALVFRDLLINYEPVESEGHFLLLKAKTRAAPKLTLLREGKLCPGEPLGLAKYGQVPLWLELNFEPTLPGRITRLFYRSPGVCLRIWGEKAATGDLEFSAPALMMAAGFLASPLIRNHDDVVDLYTGHPVLHPIAYSVEISPAAQSLWQKALHFRIYRIENPLGNGAPEELQRLKRLGPQVARSETAYAP